MSSTIRVNGATFDDSSFAQILRKYLRDNTIRLIGVQKNYATCKGLNFLSDIYRLSVRYTTEKEKAEERTIQLLVKAEPSGCAAALNMVRAQDLFVTELRVLRDVLPKVEETLMMQIGPRHIYSSKEHKLIFMEDLANRNFVMKDRQKGLSLRHCLLVIEQIARFHASSVVLHEKDPDLIESFSGGIVSEKCPRSYVRLMEVTLTNISKVISSWPGECWSRLAEKLANLSETIGERVTRAYDYEPGEFCVLNHGDCWTNNILFRENERGEPVEALLVDYQMSVYTSPAIDLFYFLSICPEIPLKCSTYDNFLAVYLNSLSGALRSVGSSTRAPTLHELKSAMHSRRAYILFAGLVLYPRMIANAEDTEDFEEVLTRLAGETKMDVFKNPDAVRALQIMIPFMDERGYLD